MATTDFQWGRIPVQGGDVSVKNTDGTNDLKAGDLVTIDTGNLMSSTQPVPGVVRSTTDDYTFGVAIESIPKGSIGRVQTLGIVQVVASGAITANTTVEADANGQVKTCAGGKPQAGLALTGTAALNDLLWMKIQQAGKGA